MSEFLVWFVGCLSATFGYTYFYYKLSNSLKENINFKIVFLFLFGVLLISILNYYKIPFVNLFLFFVFYPLLFYSIEKVNVKKLIFYVIFIWLLGAIVDILVMLFISLLLMIIKINDIFFLSEFMTFIVGLIFILFGKCSKVIDFTNNLYLKISKIKYFDFYFISFGILVLLGGCFIFLNLPDIKIDILMVLIIVLAFMILLLLIKYKINESENINYLNTLRKNNEFYMRVDDDNREFKHNLIAKLLSIKSVSNRKGMLLIEDLIRQFNKSIDFS